MFSLKSTLLNRSVFLSDGLCDKVYYPEHTMDVLDTINKADPRLLMNPSNLLVD